MSCITLVRSIASIFCLFAAAAWTVPAVAAVEGNPQVALSLNQDGFVAGEVLTLTVTIQRGTQNNTVDGWIWVRIPGGGLFYLEPDFTGFTGAPGPVVRNLTAVDFSAPVFQFPVPGFLLPGTYTFFAAGAAPGLDPFIDGNRITNLAAVEVTLQGPPTPVVDWRSEILYFALTDRFANGNPGNDNGDNDRAGDAADPSNPLGWHGGDFAGITQKIREGYFRSLGVTAIWISPVIKQTPAIMAGSGPNRGRLFTAYHGYWGDDFFALEPHFGSLEEFQALVNTAHQAGIRIVLDMVANHAGYNTQLLAAQPRWLRTGSACNASNPITQCLAGLPDFRQELPEVTAFLMNSVRFQLAASDADGIRMDTMRHVPDDFWTAFFTPGGTAGNSRIWTVGEVFSGDVGETAHYLDSLGSPSVFDFPLYFAIVDSLARGGQTSRLAEVFRQDERYSDPTRLTTFIDNHDVPRFVSEALSAGKNQAEALQRLDLALSLIFTARGIPMVYYGVEIGMQGRGDPFNFPLGQSNREDMNFALRDLSSLDERIAALAKARKTYPALSHGEQTILWESGAGGADVFAVERKLPGADTIVVVLNNEDQEVSLSALPGGGIAVGNALAPNAPLVEITDRPQHLAVNGGRLIGDIPARTLLALTAGS